MQEFSLATLLSHPFGQIVLTVVVAAITSVITVRIMGAPGARSEPPRAPAAPRRVDLPAPAEGAIVAAISAAVYAVIGPHRIVYIAAVRPGSNWTAEMRTQHHTSHAPHAHVPHH
jgi:hypothetical protein